MGIRRFHGGSIPVNESGDRIDSVPLGTKRNLSKPAADYVYWILASISEHFSGEFPEGFRRKFTE